MMQDKISIPEGHPDYPSVSQSQCGNWRVIRCPDDLQWIVQRYRSPLSAEMKVIIGNGGLWNRGITSQLKLPHSQHRGAQYDQTLVTANDRLYIACCPYLPCRVPVCVKPKQFHRQHQKPRKCLGLSTVS